MYECGTLPGTRLPPGTHCTALIPEPEPLVPDKYIYILYLPFVPE